MNDKKIPVSRPKDTQFVADIIKELESRNTEDYHRFRLAFRENSAPFIVMEHRTLGMKTVEDPEWLPSDAAEWDDTEQTGYWRHVEAAADTAWEKMIQTEQEIMEISRLFRGTEQEEKTEKDAEDIEKE
jgi:hypothetical protein